MKQPLYIMLSVFLISCGTESAHEEKVIVDSNKVDTVVTEVEVSSSTDSIMLPEEDDFEVDSTDENYATFFIIVADTSTDYYLLHKKMFVLNQQLPMPIDTMGRFYNTSKNLIALPDNDPDDIYAGDYFPRRFPSRNLSLEYLDFYQRPAGEKTIALVTGIYSKEIKADSALALLLKTEKKAFKTKSRMYIGCMH